MDNMLDRHWPPWKHEVGVSLCNSPPSLHVAVKNGAIVAFSAWNANNRGTGWFGPMGTAPEARRQGVGQVLLFRCLADMQAMGLMEATIPWVAPVDFYRKTIGAEVSRTFHRYEKVLNS